MKIFFNHTKVIFCGLFLIFFSQISFSNNNDDLYDDKSYVHLDKSFYVTGEVIWYKLYLPKAVEGKPLSVRTLVYNAKKELLESFFLKSEGKTYVNGYYKIPFNANSGVYSLVFVAQNGEYKSTNKLAEVLVPIYNDLEDVSISKEDLTVPYQDGNVEEPGVKDLNISVKLNKDKFKTRDEVISNILITDKAGNPVKANLSVSVTDWELTGEGVIAPSTFETGEVHNLLVFDNLDNEIYFPGLYMDTNENPKQANVIGVWSRLENKMHFTKSDEKGQFFLKMPDFEGKLPAQFLAYKDTSNINVRLTNGVELIKSGELVYTEGILNYLTLSRQRKKIFQLYTSLESNIQPQKTPLEVQEMKSDRNINLKEYEAFDNLAAFFLEITSAGFQFQKQKDGKYAGKVYNPKQTFEGYFPGTALIIIDGKATKNGHFAANLEYDIVETAQVFMQPKNFRKQFSAMATDGAIVITTNDPNFQLPSNEEDDILEISGLQSKAKFPVFMPADIQNNPNIPFFRPQLYWNANLETDENGAVDCSFFQSDDISTFQIEIIAQDENGKIGRTTVKYEVTKNL